MKRPSAIVLVACVLACSKRNETTPAVDASAIAATTQDAAAFIDASVALSPVYTRKLAEGRKATRERDYERAIRAFSEALAASPNNDRALAERGYAHVLAKKWEDAERDLKQAEAATRDEKLRAQIWFNRGLAAEARGHKELADSAFRMSNRLRPSKAAAAKIRGADSKCGAVIDRMTLPSQRYADWKALHAALSLPENGPLTCAEELAPPKTNEEAKHALCSDCRGSGPWVITAGGFCNKIDAHLVIAHARELLVVPLATAMGGRCTGSITELALESIGNKVHVRLQLDPGGGLVYMCHPADAGDGDGEIRPCESEDDSALTVQSACFADYRLIDAFVDLDSGMKLLEVSYGTDERRASPDPAIAKGFSVLSTDAGVTIRGFGCSETVPWDAIPPQTPLK